jgi:hypothetical protein
MDVQPKTTVLGYKFNKDCCRVACQELTDEEQLHVALAQAVTLMERACTVPAVLEIHNLVSLLSNLKHMPFH